MDSPNTDEILDMASHIEKNGKVVGKILADHGLKMTAINRSLEVLIPDGEGRRVSARSGFLLGLQLGAMRLTPLNWEPPETDEENASKCDCLICQIERHMEGL